MPEELDEEVTRAFQGAKMIVTDPGNALEAIGQNITDIVDEKGAAYSAGYVALDIAVSIAVDKGIGKLKELRRAKQLSRADDVLDVADDVMNITDDALNAADDVINKVDDVLDASDDLTGIESHGTSVIDDVAEGSTKTIDDLIGKLEETTNGKGVARNFESTGGFGQTLKDFDSLNPIDVKDIKTQYGLGKVGKLSDGTTVVARPGSTTGGATLEIRISNSIVYKIRY